MPDNYDNDAMSAKVEELARKCDRLAAHAPDYYSEQGILQAAADLWDVAARLSSRNRVKAYPGGIISRG